MVTLIYDGSFDGLLTSIFICYEEKLVNPTICPEHLYQKSLFNTGKVVLTDNEKANRVWKGLKTKITYNQLQRLYYTFLSEVENLENLLYQAIKYIFDHKENVASDYGNQYILQVSKLAKSVSRERHRMTAFVRFKLTADGIYFANISPDFNVLPLIVNHFKNRYADQKWIIYDLKRNYGIFYDLETVETIILNFKNNYSPTATSEEIFAESELEFQQLWKDYFKSTNIEERKNTKLHVRHVPKRYWKYLSEKQP